MVETQKRDVAYTTQDSSPTAALVFLLALLIVSLIGFIVYYFSNNNSALNNPTQIIERNINTETPVPVPPMHIAPAAPEPPAINPSLLFNI